MAAQEISTDDAIKTLSNLLAESKRAGQGATAEAGACVYNAGGKTYCAEISQADCNRLKGVWTSGGKCPK